MKFFKSKKNRIVAALVAAAILITGLTLPGVFANPNYDQTPFADPNEGKYYHQTPSPLDLAASTDAAKQYNDIIGGAVKRWVSSNSAVVKLLNALANPATVEAVGPGFAMVSGMTNAGAIQNYPIKVIDSRNVISYGMPAGNAMKAARGATNLAIDIDLRLGTAPDNAKSGNGKIDWVSMDTSVVTVNADRTINTANVNNSAVLVGTLTDIWGATRTLALMVQVGKVGGSVVEQPPGSDKWYVPVEGGNDTDGYFYAEANPDGELKDPPSFIYSNKELPNASAAIKRPVVWDDPDWKWQDPGSGQWYTLPDMQPTDPPGSGGATNNGQIVQGEDGKWYIKSGAKDGSGKDIWLQMDDEGKTVVIEPEILYYINVPSAPEQIFRLCEHDGGGWTDDPVEHTCDVCTKIHANIVEYAGDFYVETEMTDPADGKSIWLLMDEDGEKVADPLQYFKGLPGGATEVWPDGNGGWTTEPPTDPGETFPVTNVSLTGTNAVPGTNTLKLVPLTQVTYIDNTDPFNPQTVTEDYDPDVHGPAVYTITDRTGLNSVTNIYGSGADVTLGVHADDERKSATIQVTIGGKSAMAVFWFLPSTEPTNTIGTGRKAAGGDGSEWIELATNGGYSLIVRAEMLPSQSKFQNTGTSNAYQNSTAQLAVNTWYDSVNASASIKLYAVKNNALEQIGSYSGDISNTANGFSVPVAKTPQVEDKDIAFLLSYQEAARFCCTQYFSGSSYINRSTTDQAYKNWSALILAPVVDEWWLRSPNGDGYVCANGTGGGVWSFSFAVSMTMGIRPALWVETSKFTWTNF